MVEVRVARIFQVEKRGQSRSDDSVTCVLEKDGESEAEIGKTVFGQAKPILYQRHR